MGYDINATKSIQLAKGEFAMCLGDDDTLVEGSLGRLVANLLQHKNSGAGAVYLNCLKNGTPQTAFNFSDFRIFPKDGDYPPLSLSFGGSICLRTKIAKDIIREKIYFENGRLCKREKDKFLLFDFVHTYLFLECVSKVGFFRIEPSCVVHVQGKGASISITKRFYFDIIFNMYYIRVRENYPWIKEALFLDDGVVLHVFKRYIALSYLLIDRPDLKDAFDSNLYLSAKIIGQWAWFLFILELIRKTGALELPLIIGVGAIRDLTGNKNILREDIDTVGTPKQAEIDLFERARNWRD
jgi:hypothetical protein